MPHDQAASLFVRLEPTRESPRKWAWAIYRGCDSFLLVRSRPEFSSPTDAIDVGSAALAEIGRRLRISDLRVVPA